MEEILFWAAALAFRRVTMSGNSSLISACSFRLAWWYSVSGALNNWQLEVYIAEAEA